MHQTTIIPIDSDPLLPAALAALGFTVKPNVGLFPDNPTQAAHKKVTWHCSESSADGAYSAKELIPAWRDKSIFKTHPGHPILAGLMALQTRQMFTEWKKDLCGMPHIVKLSGSNLCRAVYATTRSQNADISPRLSGETEGMSLDHAAAAITAGHGITALRPFGCLVTTKGVFSHVTASVLAAAAAQIEADGRKSAIMPLPGYDAGEHPFLYALAAIKQARELGIAAENKMPTVHLDSKSGKSGPAIASLIYLETDCPMREHIYRHIR